MSRMLSSRFGSGVFGAVSTAMRGKRLTNWNLDRSYSKANTKERSSIQLYGAVNSFHIVIQRLMHALNNLWRILLRPERA